MGAYPNPYFPGRYPGDPNVPPPTNPDGTPDFSTNPVNNNPYPDPSQLGMQGAPAGGSGAPSGPGSGSNQGGNMSQPFYNNSYPNPGDQRDVFNINQRIGQNAYSQNQDWQNQFTNSANNNQAQADAAGQNVNNQYANIWNGGGGYSQQQQDAINQSQGLHDAQAMSSQVAGNPYQTFDNYNSNIAPGMNNISATYAGAAMKGAQHGEAGGLAALQYGQGAVDKAAGNPALNPTSTYLQQAGMSDQQVNDTAEAAARGVGAQYQSAEDQVRQNAQAAGNSSPLAVASAMGSLANSSAAGQADALTNARLSALAQQRQAATGIQNTQLQAGQYQAGLGTQAGLALTNAALQNNQSNTAANVAATEWAGNQSMNNAQYNANMATGLQGQAEQNASNRAAQIQQTNLGINQLQSGRGTQIANMQQQQQQEGRGAAVQQQGYYGNQTNVANQFRQQGQGQANNAQQNAANAYGAWGAGGGKGFSDYLGQSAATKLGNSLGSIGGNYNSGGGGAGNFGIQFAHGGLLDHHQLIEVGEGNRPEVILPLDPSTSPLHRNIFEHMGAKLGQAMGIHSSAPENFRKPQANPFGLRMAA